MLPISIRFLLGAEQFDDIWVVESMKRVLFSWVYPILRDPFDCHIDPSECALENGAESSSAQALRVLVVFDLL